MEGCGIYNYRNASRRQSMRNNCNVTAMSECVFWLTEVAYANGPMALLWQYLALVGVIKFIVAVSRVSVMKVGESSQTSG